MLKIYSQKRNYFCMNGRLGVEGENKKRKFHKNILFYVEIKNNIGTIGDS